MYELNQTFRFFKDVERELFCDKKLLGDIFQVTDREIERINSTQEIGFKSLAKASEYLGVTLENIVEGKIDFKVIIEQVIKPSSALPDIYKIHAGTYMSNIKSMLDYVSGRYNYQTASTILRHFQISKQALLNNDLLVNIHLAEEILAHLVNQLNLPRNHFDQLVYSSFTEKKRKAVLENATQLRSSEQVLSNLVDHATQFELNFDYSFKKLNDKRLVIATKSKEVASDLLGTNVLASEMVNQFKLSTMRTLHYLILQREADVCGVESYFKNGYQHVDFVFKENSLSGLLH